MDNLDAAFHEAGHAVAYCHFGRGIEYAAVSAEGSRIGGVCVCLPRVSGPSALTAPIGVHREICRRELICTMAGGVVDIRRGRDVSGAAMDASEALALARRFWEREEDARTVLKEASAATTAFVAEPEVWAQITTVADVLIKDGRIEGAHPLLRNIKRREKLPRLRA
jgi:hypothetical protein